MIEYLFLSAGAGGAASVLWYVAPAGRGLHRYVVPRARLRADVVRLEREADDLTCALLRVTTENTALSKDRDTARDALKAARARITDLAEQLVTFDSLCAENTRLRADLENARAIRPLPAADDAPTLPQGIPVLPLSEAPLAQPPTSD
ncbi:hypothetical protein RI578_06715 [Streptomyces sp. BB1-1-1]|uniref:hypothetical protein n=1 Tax=Streptomyces sp. BB1-1-1 TaxID=3074430 RepID=UPI0028777D9E|nr:hypothetical protein [Streptomyces sp. BB1-1-1]WND34005.1 hypothetical protein RI578_06715 [Streptomyces sp. BB1-1-1]